MTLPGRGNVPAPVKGRVLFIGTSYYNNWYLSRELRKRGWKADLLVCSAEGAKHYLHGCDAYLEEYLLWDKKYRKGTKDFLEPLLKEASWSEPSPMGHRTTEPPWKAALAAVIRNFLKGHAGKTACAHSSRCIFGRCARSSRESWLY